MQLFLTSSRFVTSTTSPPSSLSRSSSAMTRAGPSHRSVSYGATLAGAAGILRVVNLIKRPGKIRGLFWSNIGRMSQLGLKRVWGTANTAMQYLDSNPCQ